MLVNSFQGQGPLVTEKLILSGGWENLALILINHNVCSLWADFGKAEMFSKILFA